MLRKTLLFTILAFTGFGSLSARNIFHRINAAPVTACINNLTGYRISGDIIL